MSLTVDQLAERLDLEPPNLYMGRMMAERRQAAAAWASAGAQADAALGREGVPTSTQAVGRHLLEEQTGRTTTMLLRAVHAAVFEKRPTVFVVSRAETATNLSDKVRAWLDVLDHPDPESVDLQVVEARAFREMVRAHPSKYEGDALAVIHDHDA